MTISPGIINKLKENYESLETLEAINAFYQIKGLVTEETQKHPCQLQDSLLQLHQHLLAIIHANPQKESLTLESFKKLINFIEEDIHRVINNADHILATTYKVRRLFSF